MSTEFTPEQEKYIQEKMEETWFTTEARIMKIMKEHFGEEAYRIYMETIGDGVRNHWNKLALEAGDNSIKAFLERQWQPSGENCEYIMEETDSGYQFNVTKCRWVEKAKTLDITEHMFYMVCEFDSISAEGFNPNIGFKRTKTLMQGDDCCDHFYYYKDKK